MQNQSHATVKWMRYACRPWPTGLAMRRAAGRLLLARTPVLDLLIRAKHLFVAAMVAWVHPGPDGETANQNMTAGQSALEP